MQRKRCFLNDRTLERISFTFFDIFLYCSLEDVKSGFLLALTLSGLRNFYKNEYEISEEVFDEYTQQQKIINRFADTFIEKWEIHIEFKNISIGQLYKNEDDSQPLETTSWEEQSKKNNELKNMTPTEIKQMSFLAFIGNSQREKKKVQWLWDELLAQTKKNKNLIEKKIKKKVDSFAVMRIGLHTIF